MKTGEEDALKNRFVYFEYNSKYAKTSYLEVVDAGGNIIKSYDLNGIDAKKYNFTLSLYTWHKHSLRITVNKGLENEYCKIYPIDLTPNAEVKYPMTEEDLKKGQENAETEGVNVLTAIGLADENNCLLSVSIDEPYTESIFVKILDENSKVSGTSSKYDMYFDDNGYNVSFIVANGKKYKIDVTVNNGSISEKKYSKTIFVSIPYNSDSDGDGLYDNNARIVNNKKVAPKDPDPNIVNAPIRMWDAHVNQLEHVENPTTLKNMNISTMLNSIELPNNLDETVATAMVIKALEIREKLIECEHQEEIKKYVREGALMIRELSRGECKAFLGASILNFAHDNDKIAYHSQPDTWQRVFGYNQLYDEIFEIGTHMSKEKFEFSVDGQGYVLWMWKGDYWNLCSGAEFGLYIYSDTYSNVPHYDAIDFELPMSLSLYNYKSPLDISNVFSWFPEEEQWWITGFNPKYAYPDPNAMVSVGSIDFSEHLELFDALKNTKMVSNTIYNDYLILDEDAHTLWIMWYEGVDLWNSKIQY